MILGIDYGAKLAGTTVIARLFKHNKVDFFSSQKGQDADAFILTHIQKWEESWLLFLDAPLSLPAVYRSGEEDGDYFYRLADRETQAMSPMFLGGLSARAMRLAKDIRKEGVQVVETYPGKLTELLGLKKLGYKKDKAQIEEVALRIMELSKFDCDLQEIKTWHHVDALLCLFAAKRHETGKSEVFGSEAEGQIIV